MRARWSGCVVVRLVGKVGWGLDGKEGKGEWSNGPKGANAQDWVIRRLASLIQGHYSKYLHYDSTYTFTYSVIEEVLTSYTTAPLHCFSAPLPLYNSSALQLCNSASPLLSSTLLWNPKVTSEDEANESSGWKLPLLYSLTSTVEYVLTTSVYTLTSATPQ